MVVAGIIPREIRSEPHKESMKKEIRDEIFSPQSLEDNTFSNTVYLQLDELPIKEDSSRSQDVSELSHSTHDNSIYFFSQELLDLVKSANAGRALLATYSQSGLLDSIGRKRLCNIIINKELQDDVNRKVPSSRLQDLAYQITTIFNNEHTATYFIPYISYGPGLKRAAKGKLLDCLYNKRRDHHKSGLISPSRNSTLSSSGHSSPILLPESLRSLDDKTENNEALIEDNLNWLHNSNDPWNIVENNWIITANTRLKKFY
ncbi:uncharacterized protein LOC132934909 [Metopolophium dirhodum]|uniref:uncharacterized protein LOC132934909 n=1 Tax=Metopolophium dirhodum TaxID=44670 RepID=UPI00298F51F7|nr:uncharacterized protein LOC132934909 [Metopolophium dirhodum]